MQPGLEGEELAQTFDGVRASPVLHTSFGMGLHGNNYARGNIFHTSTKKHKPMWAQSLDSVLIEEQEKATAPLMQSDRVISSIWMNCSIIGTCSKFNAETFAHWPLPLLVTVVTVRSC